MQLQIDKFAYPVKWNDSTFIHKNKLQIHERISRFVDLILFDWDKVHFLKDLTNQKIHMVVINERLCSVKSTYNQNGLSENLTFSLLGFSIKPSIQEWIIFQCPWLCEARSWAKFAHSNYTCELYIYYFAFTILIVW